MNKFDENKSCMNCEWCIKCETRLDFAAILLKWDHIFNGPDVFHLYHAIGNFCINYQVEK